jgi:AraC-like DNA-binding protein
VTLAAAARAASVSERTLRRLATAELRTSWREYVNQTRMIRAMALLCDPSQRVARVAEMTGFSSLSAFSARFHQFAGETPRDFRGRAAGRSGQTAPSG